MARTAVAITALTSDAGVAAPAGTAVDVANGMSVAANGLLNRLLLLVSNTAATSKNVTVRKGAAYPSGPAFRAGLGDLVVAVPAGTSKYIGPFESARFEQADGGVYIDLGSGMTGTVAALSLPYGI